jgi:hypothetical protein
MKAFLLICLSAVFLATGPCAAAERMPCGSVKSVSGKVVIQRQEKDVIAAETGTRIYPLDRIESGKNSSASLILQDDTIICIGPESTMNMEEFTFIPSKYEYSMATRLLKGTFLFLSGVIAKIAPDNMKIQTPDGTIAVRGTRFLVEVKK